MEAFQDIILACMEFKIRRRIEDLNIHTYKVILLKLQTLHGTLIKTAAILYHGRYIKKDIL